MENIRIIVAKEDYIVVKADHPRFGKDAVMFEGNHFDECFQYIRRELGIRPDQSLKLRGWMSALYMDRMGSSFPSIMEVLC